MWSTALFYVTLILALIETEATLWCYRCVSSQAGCGSDLNIRLQRWQACPPTGPGYDNFCVKVVQRKGSENIITRECMTVLLKDSYHRQRIPSVRRHNYCEQSRSTEPGKTYNKNEYYCFCNDWNGCNHSGRLSAKLSIVAFLGLGAVLILRLIQ